MEISDELGRKLKFLGIIPEDDESVDTRNVNVGNSNYSKHLIQPWSVWLDYPELTEFDKDIIKRVLRTKDEFTAAINEFLIYAEYDKGINTETKVVMNSLYEKFVSSGHSARLSRVQDYEKIIHICKERIRQLRHIEENE